MKRSTRLFFVLSMTVLAACSATVEGGGGDAAPATAPYQSPETQALKVNAPAAEQNEIVLNGHAGGDKKWFFTYTATETGMLRVVNPHVTTINCPSSNEFIRFLTIETIQDGRSADLRYFTATVASHSVTAGQNYRLTYSIQKLGPCTLAVGFKTEFQKL
ncbi:MAG: hypothetical protein AB7F59_13285 [Bdellovibrionales bacterium]